MGLLKSLDEDNGKIQDSIHKIHERRNPFGDDGGLTFEALGPLNGASGAV